MTAKNTDLEAAVATIQAELRIINGTLTALVETAAELARLYQMQSQDDTGPNYRRKLSEYRGFDWYSINAHPVREDRDGALTVAWGGQDWHRRSGAGKYGQAIWFSRPNGTDESGATNWLRLITFKDYDDPEPLDPRISQAVDNGHTSPAPGQANAPAMPQAQAIPPNDARAQFQALARKAIRQSILPHTAVNGISALAPAEGWPGALAELNQAIRQATAV